MILKIKKLSKKAKTPTRGSAEAAGLDLYAVLDEDVLSIPPHSTKPVNIQIAIEIPKGTFGAIYARSGLATKKSLALINSVGVIDSDYRGPVIVALHNFSDEEKTIENGERIAQLVITPYLNLDIEEVEELTDSERGEGGFGSTGSK